MTTTATAEKLFLQIFERKNSIIQQVKHQTDLFNQHLATKLLVDGIAPPPWLWGDNLSSNVAKGLNKEDLISEILLPPPPRPIIHFQGACCSLYNRPVGEGDKGELLDGILKEAYSYNQCFESGNKDEVVANCVESYAGCDVDVAPELDVSVTSLPDETEARISSIVSAKEQSVARFQRSNSRQKALEIAANCMENNAGRDTDVVPELDFSIASPSDETEARSIFSAKGQSVARFHRSKSRQKALEHRNSAKTEARSCLNQQDDHVVSSLADRFSIFNSVEDQVIDLRESGEPRSVDRENRGVGEACEGCSENNNKDEGVSSFTGTNSGSRCSTKQPGSAKDLVKGNSSNCTLEKNDSTVVKDGQDFPQCSEVETEDILNLRENGSHTCGNKISRPRYFLDEASERDISIEAAMVDGGITVKSTHKSAQELNDADEFLELPEHSVGLVHEGARSQTNFGDEGMPKLLDASILPDNTNTNSVSSARDKPQSANYQVQNCSDDQLTFHSLDPCNAADQQGKFKTVTSDATVNGQPATSKSSLFDAGLECLFTRSPSNYLVFMEPKQLVFDEREESNLRDMPNLTAEEEGNLRPQSNLTAEHERLESSPVKVFDTSSHPSLLLDHETISNSMIPFESTTLESEVPITEEEVHTCSLNTNLQEHVDSETVAYVSNCKVTFSKDIVEPNVIESPTAENEVNVCSKEVSEPEMRNEGDFRCKESIDASQTSESKLFMASNMPCSADKAIGVPGDCLIEEVGTLGSNNILLDSEGQYWEDCKDCTAFIVPQKMESSDMGGNNSVTCASVGSPLASHEIFDFSGLLQNQISKKSGAQDLRAADSWPISKRRKIQEKETECFSDSPRFRIKKYCAIQMESSSIKKGEDDAEIFMSSASPVNKSAEIEMYENLACQLTEEMESSPKLQTEEFASTSEHVEATSLSEQNQAGVFSNVRNSLATFSQGCLLEVTALVDASTDATEANDSDEHSHWLHLEGEGLVMETSHLQGTSYLGLDGRFTGVLGLPLSERDLDLSVNDQTMPVLESFSINQQMEDEEAKISGHGIDFDKLELTRTSIERASILEQICKSTITQTPLTQFSSALKLHESSKFCRSVPNGLSEYMDLRSISAFNEDVQKQLRAGYMDNANGGTHKERPFSDSIPSLGARCGWNSRNPYASPLGKLWEGISLHTGSSEKRLSSNPELTCFPIEEDPSSSDENENASDLTEKNLEDNNSLDDTCAKRKPLADITEINARTSISAAEISVSRASLDSINTEVILKGTFKKVKPKKKGYCRNKSEGKENDVLKIAAGATKKAKESAHNRLRKTSCSSKTSLKKDMQNLSVKEPKHNNIVSNITSFVPLVLQKQTAAVCTGKRDVKVKALEIAEAVKRLEEKKENERKMRKEALKLERARMEQENLQKMELTKKKKEEGRKKRDADIVARKRQREEEQKMEKERKRKRIEETRRMKREESTLCTQKVDKKNQGERDLKHKEPDNQLQKSQKMVRDFRDGMNLEKSETQQAPVEFTFQANTVETCATSGEHANAARDRTGRTDYVIAPKSQEKSYEISPYQCSDDDDDDEVEEEERNRKFIPSWASKSCVALVLPLQQGVDPSAIFAPESFCRTDEVCPSPNTRRMIKGAKAVDIR